MLVQRKTKESQMLSSVLIFFTTFFYKWDLLEKNLGKIRLHDPSTLRVEHVFEAHSASLSDFDTQGSLLITAGFSAGYVLHMIILNWPKVLFQTFSSYAEVGQVGKEY